MSPFLHLLVHPQGLHVGRGWRLVCTMPITKSSFLSIIVALTHFLLFRRLIKQPDIIAIKFSVWAMAITYTPLQCNIYTSPMDTCFMCHVTIEDTHHLAHFSLQHRCYIFGTSFGTASYTLSTVVESLQCSELGINSIDVIDPKD
jgi:hypothetical protein